MFIKNTVFTEEIGRKTNNYENDNFIHKNVILETVNFYEIIVRWLVRSKKEVS